MTAADGPESPGGGRDGTGDSFPVIAGRAGQKSMRRPAAAVDDDDDDVMTALLVAVGIRMRPNGFFFPSEGGTARLPERAGIFCGNKRKE